MCRNFQAFFCLVLLQLIQGQKSEDFAQISESWESTLLENIGQIGDFSARVLRSPTTKFLSNQAEVFQEFARKRIEPLLPEGQDFAEIYPALLLDVDCRNPANSPLIFQDLTQNGGGNSLNSALLKRALNDFWQAECKKRVDLQRAFVQIDKISFFIRRVSNSRISL